MARESRSRANLDGLADHATARRRRRMVGAVTSRIVENNHARLRIRDLESQLRDAVDLLRRMQRDRDTWRGLALELRETLAEAGCPE